MSTTTLDPTAIPILAPASATAAQARAYARSRGARRPEEVEAFIAELWALGGSAGYDPAVVFAQFCDETGVGTSPAWVERLNPGGIGITDWHDQGIAFRSGADAARAMLVHLSAYVRGYDHALWRWLALDSRYLEPLKRGWGAQVSTLDGLAGKWATNPRYAHQIAAHLAALRAMPTPTTDPSVSPPASRPLPPASSSPPAARPAPPALTWLGTPNFHERPAGIGPEAIVYHVTDDLEFAHVRDWFQRPESRASSHFVVERDGAIFQFVPTLHAAWTNGVINEPRQDLPWLAAALRRCAPHGPYTLNDFTVTIECMGKPGLPFPAPQVASVIALTRYLLDRYPAIRPTRDRLLRHADIDAVNRPYCPGPTFPLGEVIAAAGGG